MNFYENYILPYLIHWACSIKPIMYQRKKVIPMAKGTVLEVGIGTGLNLPFYDLNKINKVIGLEPSKKMHTKANETARRSNVSLELIDRYAEDIPLDDDSVDTIVVTYTLCSINETDNALKELHRVLKNDGLFLTQYCTESSKSIFIPADKNYIESTINELNFNIIQSEKFSTIHDENFTGINLLLSK